jgi:hypothetical protein
VSDKSKDKQFHGVQVPNRKSVQKLVNKGRTAGILTDKKPNNNAEHQQILGSAKSHLSSILHKSPE